MNVTNVTMSSLVCAAGKCTFTRVNTNATAIVPPDYYESLPVLSLSSAATSSKNNKNGDRRHLQRNGTIPLLPEVTDDLLDDFVYQPEVDTSSAPWFLPQNQDKLSPMVAITRDYTGSIFNAFDPYDRFYGPTGTEWALLPDDMAFEEARCSLYFCSWNDCFSQFDTKSVIGKAGVVHLIDEDLYYNFKLTKWTNDASFAAYPFGPGGGFQYERDEKPIKGKDLPKCPVCDMAKASPAELLGDIDNEFVNVTIVDVSASTTVTIKGVSQSQSLRCNLRPNTANATADPEGYGSVLPNAIITPNGKTVSLRRFRVAGDMAHYTYTVHFRGTNAVGSCDGSVSVCVPAPGYKCDEYPYGVDATASTYCDAASF